MEHYKCHKAYIPKTRAECDPDVNDTTSICRKYNLAEKAHNGYIYARMTKGMYKPPQELQIAHDALVKHLYPYEYHPSMKTPDYVNTTVNQ